jgi:hypothetical protein
MSRKFSGYRVRWAVCTPHADKGAHRAPLIFPIRAHHPSGLNTLRGRRFPIRTQRAPGWNRREFLDQSTFAGTAGLLGLDSGPVATEPPPETTRIRLTRIPGICLAPQYVAEELLRGEGFTKVQYIYKDVGADAERALSVGEIGDTQPGIEQRPDHEFLFVHLAGVGQGVSLIRGQGFAFELVGHRVEDGLRWV